MEKLEVKKIFRRIVLFVFLGHFVLSFIHLLVFYMGHPLFDMLNEFPIWVQVVGVSLWNFIAYVVVGIILGVNRDDQPLYYLLLDRALILLALFLILVYGAIYISTYWYTLRNIWLIYSLLNALFGTYMYRLPTESILSLWWVVSTIVPSIAMFVGALIRMHFEEKKS
ncbi:hypothetical protein AOC36_01725 [Erysipelothrix larvae]|uniref:Uncharacterized protein n=1 Tax=Erysipelothrix larvae TaxID=1514105 RepID=A0A0X8GYG3_9FIRM|nr:hypothetical protein [Erysipelothrix larvae]AMC92749.1 hypothetical protein AOC36_01725 [Erysipelothrix larvae]